MMHSAAGSQDFAHSRFDQIISEIDRDCALVGFSNQESMREISVMYEAMAVKKSQRGRTEGAEDSYKADDKDKEVIDSLKVYYDSKAIKIALNLAGHKWRDPENDLISSTIQKLLKVKLGYLTVGELTPNDVKTLYLISPYIVFTFKAPKSYEAQTGGSVSKIEGVESLACIYHSLDFSDKDSESYKAYIRIAELKQRLKELRDHGDCPEDKKKALQGLIASFPNPDIGQLQGQFLGLFSEEVIAALRILSDIGSKIEELTKLFEAIPEQIKVLKELFKRHNRLLLNVAISEGRSCCFVKPEGFFDGLNDTPELKALIEGYWQESIVEAIIEYEGKSEGVIQNPVFVVGDQFDIGEEIRSRINFIRQCDLSKLDQKLISNGFAGIVNPLLTKANAPLAGRAPNLVREETQEEYFFKTHPQALALNLFTQGQLVDFVKDKSKDLSKGVYIPSVMPVVSMPIGVGAGAGAGSGAGVGVGSKSALAAVRQASLLRQSSPLSRMVSTPTGRKDSSGGFDGDEEEEEAGFLGDEVVSDGEGSTPWGARVVEVGDSFKRLDRISRLGYANARTKIGGAPGAGRRLAFGDDDEVAEGVSESRGEAARPTQGALRGYIPQGTTPNRAIYGDDWLHGYSSPAQERLQDAVNPISKIAQEEVKLYPIQANDGSAPNPSVRTYLYHSLGYGYWGKRERANNFRAVEEVYGSDEAAKEDIMLTFFSATICAANKFGISNLREILRIVLKAKTYGGLSNIPEDVDVSEKVTEQEKQLSKEYQETCQKAGLLSGRTFKELRIIDGEKVAVGGRLGLVPDGAIRLLESAILRIEGDKQKYDDILEISQQKIKEKSDIMANVISTKASASR